MTIGCLRRVRRLHLNEATAGFAIGPFEANMSRFCHRSRQRQKGCGDEQHQTDQAYLVHELGRKLAVKIVFNRAFIKDYHDSVTGTHGDD